MQKNDVLHEEDREIFNKMLCDELDKSEIEQGISRTPENLAAREEFSTWLEKKWLGKKQDSILFVKKTMTALDIVEARCRKINLIESGLYEIVDIARIEQLTEKIVLNPTLIDIRTKKLAYTLYNALEIYSSFLKKGSEDFEVSETIEEYDIPTIEGYDGPINEAGFIAFLERQEVEYIDKRSKGGGFWIKGRFANAELVKYCKSKFGIKFIYNNGSARVLKGKPGWWTRKLC